MKIFVTGVAGFLGSHLADALLAAGHEVVGNDNLIGGYRENVPAGVEFHEIDCNDLVKLREIMRGAEIVYHCAALPHEGLSVCSPYQNAVHGYTASAAVFSAAVQTKVRRVVMCSSMARYGAQPDALPYRESLPPRPEDPYGIGKVGAEDLLRLLGKVYGLETVCIVPHNIYGPRQKHDDIYRNVVSIMVNLMLRGEQPFIYGDGEQRRCFSYYTDAVDPLVRAGFSDHIVGETINIGPDDEFVSINDLAKLIAKQLHFDLHPEYLPNRPQEVILANCSADKARRLLGYEPKVSLEEGVRQTIDWIRKRGPKPFQYHLDLEIEGPLTPKVWRERKYA